MAELIETKPEKKDPVFPPRETQLNPGTEYVLVRNMALTTNPEDITPGGTVLATVHCRDGVNVNWVANAIQQGLLVSKEAFGKKRG